MNGWMGRILWIDLGTGSTWTEEPDSAFYGQFLGTYGLGARLLYTHLPGRVEPLGPENILGLTTGPITRSSLPCTSRFTAVGKSPLTGTWGDANSGGHFGMALKGAGFDAIFVTGAAQSPVYVQVHEGKAELRPADHLWGMDTARTDEAVKSETGTPSRSSGDRAPAVRVACIGPAGERLARISGIVTDGGRLAARSGLGAVMGAKKLKAVAVSGNARPLIHKTEPIDRLRQRILAMTQDPNNLRMASLQTYGTAGGMEGPVLSNHCPIKNWKGIGARDYPHAANLDGDDVIAGKVSQYRCGGCAVGCGAILRIPVNGQLVEMHRPEYESLSAFGPLLLIDNLQAILQANHLCNLAGLDTISAGTALAFAMECFEQGLVTTADTGGIDLTWGNAQGMLAMLDKLIRRQDLGDLLADGAGWASQRLGRGSEQFAMVVHGEALPQCDPRGTPGWATTYTTDATPARHMQGGSALPELGMGPADYVGVPAHDPVERCVYGSKGAVAAETVKLMHAVNCSGACAFIPISFQDLMEALSAITGHDYDYEELLRVGERAAILRQAFNLREGLQPAGFALPERVRGCPPLEAGPTAGVTIDLALQNRAFYESMDWDPVTGIPSGRRILELGGLDDVFQDLHRTASGS